MFLLEISLAQGFQLSVMGSDSTMANLRLFGALPAGKIGGIEVGSKGGMRAGYVHSENGTSLHILSYRIFVMTS